MHKNPVSLLDDPKADDAIRAALRSAFDSGMLGTVAAVTGIAGGIDELVTIMNSKGDLSPMDRGMLGMFLLE